MAVSPHLRGVASAGPAPSRKARTATVSSAAVRLGVPSVARVAGAPRASRGPGDADALEAPRPLPPPLKWAGGKRWQVPHLLELWQPHRDHRLVEPFCGGLAVALGLGPARARLNDANPHLINFYRWAARGFVPTLAMKNDEATFYAHRTHFNRLITEGRAGTAEAATLFYYLNRTGFNGLCRFNRSGLFNVPFGRYATIGYLTSFKPYRRALAGWTFSQGSFEQLTLSPDDFVYADPPYDVPFTAYSAGGFDWAAQVRTAEWLAAHRGPVVLVNQATSRIETLYRRLGFALRYLDAPRRISCDGDRTAAREVLATRNL